VRVPLLPCVRHRAADLHTRPVIRARQLKDRLLPLALAIGAGGAFGYLLAARQRESARIIETTTFDRRPAQIHLRANERVFDIVVPSKQAKSTHATLGAHETESFLKANERSVSLDHRPMNPILQWDTNFVPANAVCEDRIVADLLSKADIDELVATSSPFWPAWREIRTRILSIVPRWTSQSPDARPGLGDEDIAFFSVLDGHEGIAVVEVVAKALHATLARALGMAELFARGSAPLAEVVEKAYVASTHQ